MMNDSIRPKEVRPTLAVYGAVPRFYLLCKIPSPFTNQGAIVVKNNNDPSSSKNKLRRDKLKFSLVLKVVKS